MSLEEVRNRQRTHRRNLKLSVKVVISCDVVRTVGEIAR